MSTQKRKADPDRDIIQKPRNRVMGGLTTWGYTFDGGPIGSPPIWHDSFPDTTTKGTLKTMSDVVTVPYKAARAMGIRPNKPMTMSITTRDPFIVTGLSISGPYGYGVVNGATLAHIAGRLEGNYPDSPINYERVNAQATLATWAKVEPAKSQSLVTVIEAHKSWKTIYDRARKLAKVVEACRRLDVKALNSMMPGARSQRKSYPKRIVLWDEDGRPLLTKRGKTKNTYGHNPREFRFTENPAALDEVSKLWLEYRYGWSPLVYDMIDTLKAVYAADLRHELIPKDVLTARGKASTKEFRSNAQRIISDGLAYDVGQTFTFEYTVRGYIHYRWSAPDGLLRRVNDFGLFDVPKAIWEIVPFSFIADWFIPVGDWLGAITPKIGVEIIDMGHITDLQMTGMQRLQGYPRGPTAGENNNWSPKCPVGVEDHCSDRLIERKPFLGLPMLPPIDVKINVKRMADVAALFRRIR